jgi:hypothetical protein
LRRQQLEILIDKLDVHAKTAAKQYGVVAAFGSTPWETAAMVRVADLWWCYADKLYGIPQPRDSRASRKTWVRVQERQRKHRHRWVERLWKRAEHQTTGVAGGVDWSDVAAQRATHPPDC